MRPDDDPRGGVPRSTGAEARAVRHASKGSTEGPSTKNWVTQPEASSFGFDIWTFQPLEGMVQKTHGE